MNRKKTRSDGVIRMLPGERFTPFALARKLSAKILFESSSFERGRSRYSLLVVDEAFRLIQRGREVIFKPADGEERPFASAPARDVLAAAAYFADQHPALHQDFPYPCGGFGYVGYEFAALSGGVRPAPKRDDIGVDDAVFLFGHVYLIYDHHADVIYLHGVNYHERAADLDGLLDAVERRIRDFDFNYLAEPGRPAASRILGDPDGERDFLAGVRDIRTAIEAGRLGQCALSRRLEVETDQPSFESYRRLRSANPSPYMFHIDFGSCQLFGASPEVHVKLKEGRLTVKPLAGSRPRAPDPAVNAARERELLDDERERAKHLMLVDLARNDLGRVARPGSVTVAELMAAERSSRATHLSSRVEAELGDGADPLDAIRLSFPAGAVSGVPRTRAMETLDRLEKFPRRHYSGIVGFLEPGGEFDACVAVNCCLQKGRRLWLHAGVGIVHDSVPEAELAETNRELDAMLGALGLGAQGRGTACMS